RLCGYEALSRWDDPEYGLLLPEEFLPTLVEARQIHRLDCYMIRHVCRDIRAFIDAGKTAVPVSLNLSRMDFEMEDMLAIVDTAVTGFGLQKEFLHFELSEGMLAEDREDMQKELVRFRDAGYLLGMDDFGGRNSTLHILKDMPFDTLKIDSAFIREFGEGYRARIILKNIMNMAKELGIQTMMGNIEDVAVMDFLREIGCEKTQGLLYGEPAPLDDERHEKLLPENDMERDYVDAIGRVNILSQSPLKTGWGNQEADASLVNLLPIAIMEFNGKRFSFLMYNENFQKVFTPLGVDGDTDPEHVFNNEMLTFSTQVRAIAEQCIYTGTEYDQDFVTSDGFYRLMMRCVSYNVENDSGALVAVVERMSEDDPNERGERMDASLRFLYSLYSRVDIITGDGSDVKNVYIDTSRYDMPFVRGSLQDATPKFVKQNIYVEDQKKFNDFLDLSTIDERLNEVGGRYVVDYFRTRDAKGNYDWQMYMMIPVISEGQKMFLLISRGIDAERMRRLPEITQSGVEYYDMPGNPVYLLLASSAFTNMLNYGSFDQFLRNSFFVEADLSSNVVANLHLGKQEIIDDDIASMGIPYDEVIREMITGSTVEEYKSRIEDFYNRERLLESYANGEINGNVEYLRLPDQQDSAPRYMNTCYQMRQMESGDIHIFILTFDVDSYRRTNETIHRLAERDPLTGLYNRSTSGMLIGKIMADEDTVHAALIILDLDNFKQINDRYGHDGGDQILKDASSRMKDIFEPHGLVARIGGDEFLAVLKNLPASEVDRLLKEFTETKKTVPYHEHSITYTMSIGYAMFPSHGTEYNELYQNADLALYTVKMAGRNSYKRFMPNMQAANRA
ncbi:MAG: GGDEF domain-containing protein, partial [Lachnospiraceae bacterium]|nr:GGDEF domain-containing protein [Lachnospiraceae bacterium]